MSTHTEHSAWSPDEVDSLENIDKEVQLISTSTETHSTSNQTHKNGSGGHKKVISNLKTEAVVRQSTLNNFHSKSFDNLQAIKCNESCDNPCSQRQEKKFSFKFYESKNAEVSENFASTLLNNHSSVMTGSLELSYRQNKTKDNVNKNVGKIKEASTKNTVMLETNNKQDYLEQINEQLTKELDEKNAILSLLQENYEHLLFKYAEAQNRIDELRIKFLAEKTESKSFQAKYEVLNNYIPHFFNGEHFTKADIKCEKAAVPPFLNLDEHQSPTIENAVPPISRPSSLPLDNNLKFGEREMLKAATPTDSEGLSSIITSMSGHSKILNSLDEENQISKKSNIFQYKKNNFILQENTMSNDPFDKVKNWQNSLPPLEQIETPETTLYNINNAYSSNDTNYKEISSPKIETDCVFSDESCPLSWREENHAYNKRCEIKRSEISLHTASVNISQCYSKKPLSSAKKREQFHEASFPPKDKSPSQSNIPSSTCILPRRQKRPPLLRCSSLPAYDYDSIKSGNEKNGIYIPPLDLNNMTLSDDESYCQQDYYLNKSNGAPSSSVLSSREDSINRSIQTPQSFSSCKATISEERFPRQTVNKSTSITPERTRAMDMCFTNCGRTRFNVTSPTFENQHINRYNSKSMNRCNVCGEFISGDKSNRFFGSRSNSCESVRNRDPPLRETPGRRSKPPFKRSVSFGSGTNTPRYCSHEKQSPKDYFSGLNEDSIENFDLYASNLKARSQLVMKALTAHVNNS